MQQEQQTVRQKLVDMQMKRRTVPQERQAVRQEQRVVQRKQKITLPEIKTQQSFIMKKH